MAKRTVKWSLEGCILTVSKIVGEAEGTSHVSETDIASNFDLSRIWPTFAEGTEVQRHLQVYGVKQILMDTGANDLGDPDTKIQSAKKKFEDLCNGVVRGERVNGTGAAENKKVMGTVKDALKTVTLEGLMLKKMLKPAEFTAEDAEKLNEFMEIALAANAK